jgi:predicted XRE-type DNA-binding protein
MPLATNAKRKSAGGATHVVGSDNTFADLGLPNADELLRKADLLIAIVAAIRAAGLDQTAAAAALEINQPKVSRLLNGHLNDFSVERLLRFLVLLRHDVTITIRPAGRPGRLEVVTGRAVGKRRRRSRRAAA